MEDKIPKLLSRYMTGYLVMTSVYFATGQTNAGQTGDRGQNHRRKGFQDGWTLYQADSVKDHITLWHGCHPGNYSEFDTPLEGMR